MLNEGVADIHDPASERASEGSWRRESGSAGRLRLTLTPFALWESVSPCTRSSSKPRPQHMRRSNRANRVRT